MGINLFPIGILILEVEVLRVRSRFCTAVAFGVMVSCLGCAEERPTRPVGQISLRAMNLSDNPIVEMSDSVAGVAVNDSEFVLHLGGIPMVDQGQEDDIQISFNFGLQSWVRQASVFDHLTRVWKTLGYEAKMSMNQSPPSCEPCTSWTGSRTLRDLDSTVGRFVNARGDLYLRAFGAKAVSAKALKYRQDYEFIPIETWGYPSPDALTLDGRVLWVHFWDLGRGPIPDEDRFIQFDVEGNLVKRIRLFNIRIVSLVYVAGSYWALWDDYGYPGPGFPPDRVSILDSSGNFSSTFYIVLPQGWFTQSMALVQQSLWLVTQPSGEMYGSVDSLLQIDLSPSVSTGVAQFSRGLAIPLWHGTPYIAGQDQNILLGEYRARYRWNSPVLRYNTAGAFVDSLALPVVPGVGMAWDGEALWMLHHGPPEAYTDATLLSRFYIR